MIDRLVEAYKLWVKYYQHHFPKRSMPTLDDFVEQGFHPSGDPYSADAIVCNDYTDKHLHVRIQKGQVTVWAQGSLYVWPA